ncbi:MAG: ribonuclease P protein subunit [Candidatus Brockarchaeota archaeon]|nr:ribonuclease P protein subunit [Candidatus Brockarchaeota archaeon]
MPGRSGDGRELARRELVSLEVEVVSSTDPTLAGTKGTVIDETKNTFTIRSASGDKVVPKKVSVFRFTLPSGKTVTLAGRSLNLRPEDRLAG